MSKIRPSCYIAPTSKLTDTNNVAQPQLSFQHEAVEAFCTTQELANIHSESEEDKNGDDQPKPST